MSIKLVLKMFFRDFSASFHYVVLLLEHSFGHCKWHFLVKAQETAWKCLQKCRLLWSDVVCLTSGLIQSPFIDLASFFCEVTNDNAPCWPPDTRPVCHKHVPDTQSPPHCDFSPTSLTDRNPIPDQSIILSLNNSKNLLSLWKLLLECAREST